MLRNTLRVALRGLRNRPVITVIHVLGLSLGLACCLLLGRYALHEWSYDAFHPEADRLVRVAMTQRSADGTVQRAVTPPALGPALSREVSAAEAVVRISKVGTRNPATLRVPAGAGAPQVFESSGVMAADSTFFEVFGFELERGNPATVLDAPSNVVLTRAMAERLYGSAADAMGQPLELSAGRVALSGTVAGIAAAPPSNTHLDFEAIVPHRAFQAALGIGDDVWRLFGAYTYARVAPGTPDAALEQQLATLADTHMTFGAERGTSFSFFAQPVAGIHLHSHLQNEFAPNSRAAYVLLFGLVGLLVLGIACINFTNLATAQATQRVTEVGVRKAIGAGAGQVASRFLVEAVLLSGIALGGAFGLVAAALPLFNRLTGLAFDLAGFATGAGALASLGIALLTGLAAGSYPSFYLSRFAPADVLRGTGQRAGSGASRLRKGLVVVQFAASVALVIGAAGVHQQLVHMQSANLGFETSRLVRIDNAPVRNGQITPEAARREIEALPGVEQVTMAMWGPSQMTFTNSEVIPEGREASTSVVWTVMDPHYTETLDLEVNAGRSLMPGRAADSTAFLVNETAARQFGWTDPIGKTLRSPADGEAMGRVVGVVADMHFQSLQHAIEPAVFGLTSDPRALRTALVRLSPGDPEGALDAIAAKYRTWAPAALFNYQFVDAAYDAKYTAEKQVRTLVGGFAGLAALIACLGLFGLAAYAAERRTKEIGIRKALGATAARIVGLLSKDFLLLVGLACAVAVPVAYVALQQWLGGFAYRIALSPWLFVAASVGAAAIAGATISYQALRAAYTDPATALRDE